MTNNIIARPTAKMVEKKSETLLFLFFSDSSGIAMSADHCSVAIPIFMASNKAAIPRNTGFFQNAECSVTEVNLWRSI